MIPRAIFALLCCALASSAAMAAAPATYQRGEAFKSRPKNWQYFHPNQLYGYQPGNDKGSAGGLFLPKTYFNYYADTHLNGTFTRGTRISASGYLALDRVSANPLYTNSTYICHFSRGSNGFINTLGLALTGYNDANVLCAAILEFSDGTAYIGNSIGLPVGSGPSSVTWTYTWDPTGGTQGFGSLTVQIGGPTGATSTIDLTKTSAGLDFALNSFGLFQPPFTAPNSNSFLQLAIGRLAYTALVGKAPKLKVKTPQTIRTVTSAVPLKGTTHTSLGNRVTAVRYRVVTSTHTGRYRTAKGTTSWNATATVPSGASRVEVVAIGDNGLRTLVSRHVQRTP